MWYTVIKEVMDTSVYDISQEIFSSRIYPGNPLPEKHLLKSYDTGYDSQVSDLHFCSHIGTHVDAPLHFVPGGLDTDKMDLEKCIGRCTVVTASGELDEEAVSKLLEKNHSRRLLIHGDICLRPGGAERIVSERLVLFGTEVFTVGSQEESASVHQILLRNAVAILEGIRLEDVPDGEYFLSALPLRMNGLDASPVRAVLMDDLS